jgi:predicted deacylase
MSGIKRGVVFVFIITMSAAAGPAQAGYMHGEHYTLDQLYSAIRALEGKGRGMASIEEFGRSVEGRPLLVVKIGRPDGKDRGEILITANVHASEWTGHRVALAIADRLIQDDEKDPWVTSLLDRMEFYIIPLMNPDGYFRADKHLRYNFTMARDNANHVDLNRNWPYAKEAVMDEARGRIIGGSGFKYHPNYRGPHPLSEPENIALDNLVKEHDFFVVFDLHTVGGHFSYAWSYTGKPSPHKEIYDAMGEDMIKHQHKCKYNVHQSYDWYQIVGASKDWFYGRYGILAITIEVGRSSEFDKKAIGPIRIFNPFYHSNPVRIQEWIDNDRDALLHAIDTGFNLTGGKPLPAQDMEWVLEN